MPEEFQGRQVDRRTPLHTEYDAVDYTKGKPTYDGGQMKSDSEMMFQREGRVGANRIFEAGPELNHRKGRHHARQFGNMETKRFGVGEVDVNHTPFFFAGYEDKEGLNGTGGSIVRIQGANGILLEVDEARVTMPGPVTLSGTTAIGNYMIVTPDAVLVTDTNGVQWDLRDVLSQLATAGIIV